MLFLFVFVGLAAAKTPQNHVLDIFGFKPVQSHVYFRPQLQLIDIYERPVIVVSPNGEQNATSHNESFVQPPAEDAKNGSAHNAYYVEHGLRSLAENDYFRSLYQYYLDAGHLFGIVFHSSATFTDMFLQNKVSNFIIPEKFKLFDLLRKMRYQNIPVIYIAPKEVFKNQFQKAKFTDLYYITRLALTRGPDVPKPELSGFPVVPPNFQGSFPSPTFYPGHPFYPGGNFFFNNHLFSKPQFPTPTIVAVSITAPGDSQSDSSDPANVSTSTAATTPAATTTSASTTPIITTTTASTAPAVATTAPTAPVDSPTTEVPLPSDVTADCGSDCTTVQSQVTVE